MVFNIFFGKMTVTSDLHILLHRLVQEIDETEQEAAEGLSLIRPMLFDFPNNAILIELFVTLNNTLSAIEIYKKLCQSMAERASSLDLPLKVAQEVGRDLMKLLDCVLEAKRWVSRVVTPLENF